MTQAHTTHAPARAGKLPFGVCAGWGVGSVGVSVLLNTIAIFFPALMVTVLGQSPALAGALMTGSKLYDAGADVAIGAISDRTRSRLGRRRPYLLAGGLVGAFSLLMIFVLPHPTGWWLAPFFALALVIYSTGYSLFNVPYIAMASEMVDSYHERTRLLSFRMFFISVGQIVSVAATAALISAGGGGAAGFALMGAVMAAVTLGAMSLTFAVTRQAQGLDPAPAAKIPLRVKLASIAQNRPLMLLMTAKFLQYVGVAVLVSTQLLFLLNVLKVGYGGQVILGLATNIAGAATMPLWPRIGRRLGKRNAFMLSNALLAAVYVTWLVAKPGDPMGYLVARGVLSGFLSSGMILMGVSMLTDTMAYDRQVSGLRREGIFSSFYALVEKVGFAVGPALIGIYIAAAGYIPTTGGRLISQPQSAIDALYIALGVVSPALLLAGGSVMLFYKLDETVFAAPAAD